METKKEIISTVIILVVGIFITGFASAEEAQVGKVVNGFAVSIDTDKSRVIEKDDKATLSKSDLKKLKEECEAIAEGTKPENDAIDCSIFKDLSGKQAKTAKKKETQAKAEKIDPQETGKVNKGTSEKTFRKITQKASTGASTQVASNNGNIEEKESEEAAMEVYDYGAAAEEMVESVSPMVAGTHVAPKETEMFLNPAGGEADGVNLQPAKPTSQVSSIVVAELKKDNPKAMSAIEKLYQDEDRPSMSQAEFMEEFEKATGERPSAEDQRTHAAYREARDADRSISGDRPQRNLASVNGRDMTTRTLFDNSSPNQVVFTPDGEVERGSYRTNRRGQGEVRGREVSR